MTNRLPLFVAAAALASAACAPTPPAADSARAVPAPGDTVLVAPVAVVGSAPVSTRVVLRDPRGDIEVTGPLAPELRNLGGIELRVRGKMTGRTLESTSYEIVSVNGQPVFFGTVERSPNGGVLLRLEDGSALELIGPAAERFRPGQKAWVQGPAQVRVQVSGVVR